MSAAIVTAITAKLASVTTAGSFHAAVSGNYYHLRTPEGTNPPLCVFGVTDPAPLDRGFNGQEIEEAKITFVIYVSANASANPDVDAMAIDEKLRTAIHNVQITPTGYAPMWCVCERYGVCSIDTDAVQVESVYRITGAKTSF